MSEKDLTVEAQDILYKISDVESVVSMFLTAENTESRSAVECLRLNQQNFTELENLLEKIRNETNNIYIYAAALEKENADLKAHPNGR
ncbi:MAG: hypothetical protein MJ196_06025 [Treponemataceae bacterium]|nr:hypothetical protein [Treponemataceae bacterium]